MEYSRLMTHLKSSFRQRSAWWLLAALLASPGRPAMAQELIVAYTNFPVSGVRSNINIVGTNFLVITNFQTNANIVLEGDQTIQVNRNVLIDGGTNDVSFQGSSAVRIFTVASGCVLILQNLQVLNGASTNGGAIYNNGTLIISNCIIAGNSATNSSGVSGTTNTSGGNGGNASSGGSAAGGAIYSLGPVSIYNSAIGTNSAIGGSGGTGGPGGSSLLFGGNGGNAGGGGSAFGAAVYSAGSSNIFVYTEFFANECTAGNAGNGGASGSGAFGGIGGRGAAGGSAAGGAVYATGSVFVTNCVFARNVVKGGASGADLSDNNNGFNGGPAQGGGLYVPDVVTNAYIENSVFFENSCTGGTGGSASGGEADGGNGGSALGGGLASAATLLTIRNCTLASNTLAFGTNGSGTVNAGLIGVTHGWDICRTAGVLELSGSILSGGTNTSTNLMPNASGVTDAGYNISSDASLAPATTNTLPDRLDVMLDTLVSSYVSVSVGPADVSDPDFETMDIPAGSKAGGFIPGVPGLSFPATDELGVPRSTPASAGAYELNPLTLDTNSLPPIVIPTSPTNQVTNLGKTVEFAVSAQPAVTTNISIATTISNSASSTSIYITNISIVPLDDFAFDTNYSAVTTNYSAVSTNTTNTIVTYTFFLVTTNDALFSATNTTNMNSDSSITITNFNVTTNAANFGFQWQLDGTNLTDNATFTGVNTDNLTVKNAALSDAGSYQVVVGASLLENVTIASNFSLTIILPAKITLQPVSHPRTPYGSVVTFTVGATGSQPLTYQWYWVAANQTLTMLTDKSAISGSTSSNLTINHAMTTNEGTYYVIVSNPYKTNQSADAVLGIVPDTGKPSVTFSSPAAGARTTNSVVTGTASDAAQVAQVNYWVTNINAGMSPAITVSSNTASLGSGTTTKTWMITNGLLAGTNYITVQSRNFSGNLSTFVSREFFYEVPALFTLTNNGLGAVTGSAPATGGAKPTNGALLNIGQGYTLTAAPDKYCVLSNWDSNPEFTSNTPTLQFIMESNLIIAAIFSSNPFIGAAGIYNGLFYETNGNGVSGQTAGMLRGLTIKSNGTYSATLLLGGASFSLSGSFNSSGYASNNVSRTAEQGGPVMLEMFLGWTNGEVNGSVSDLSSGGWSSPLMAEKSSASSVSDEYTVLLSPATNAIGEIPPGDGYMLITNNKGNVTLSGALADGSSFSQTVPLGVSNEVPVYVSLYANTGLLLGWLGLSNGTFEAETTMAWIKPANKSGLYEAGFTNDLAAARSGWTNPPANVSAISIPLGTLLISNTSLTLDFLVSVKSNSVIKDATNLQTNSLKGTIAPKTGLLTITFGNGAGKGTTTGYGAMLQNSNNAGGYFVTKTNAGLIFLPLFYVTP